MDTQPCTLNTGEVEPGELEGHPLSTAEEVQGQPVGGRGGEKERERQNVKEN